MNVREQMEQASHVHKQQQEQANEQYKVNSRQRLNTIINTKMRTTFIGALSCFESSFGYLWGFGKDPKDCTETELQFRQLWDETRNQVLNLGNGQKRALQNEIAQYDISWNRYQTTFLPKDQ